MYPLEINGFPLFILATGSVIFMYALFNWLFSNNLNSQKIISTRKKEDKSYNECVT